MVGEKEMTNSTVNVRTRDNKQHGEFSIQEVVDKFNALREQRILKSEEHGWGPDGDKVGTQFKNKSGVSCFVCSLR